MTTRTTKTAENAAETGKDVAKDAAETTKVVAKDAAETSNDVAKDATRRVESLVADTQRSVSVNLEKFTKGIEGLTSFNQDNVDAFIKSSEIAAKAAEGISSEISSYSKKAFEDGVAAAQDFAAARTVTELFEKQTAYAQTAFEGWVNQATKMNEIYVATAKDISAPLGERVSAASDTVKRFTL